MRQAMRQSVGMAFVISGMVIAANTLAWWMEQVVSFDAAGLARLVMMVVFLVFGWVLLLVNGS